MRLETTPRPDYALRVNTRFIASNTVLHYSSDEMEQALKQEQQENALFDVQERAICLRCGATLHGPHCASCDIQILEINRTPSSYISQEESDSLSYTVLEGRQNDDLPPSFWAVPSHETLADVLLQQLAMLIDDHDRPIAEQLVGNLNEHGYLETSVAEIAGWLNVSIERVDYVLCQLQTLDPPGIGARDLRECLLIQLSRFGADAFPDPLVRIIIEQYLEQLGQGKLQEIAGALQVSEHTIQQAKHTIRAALHPFPAFIYQADVPSPMDRQAYYIRPDVVIRKEDATIIVELMEELRYTFHIESSTFAEIQVALDTTQKTRGEWYMHTYSTQARYFVASIRRRWHILRAILEAVVQKQRAFLEQKTPCISPLTQAALAQQLGLDESTVSRAVANKYVLLPDRRIMPLARFFDASQEPKEYLREILAQEHPDRRMSDEELANLLATKGIPIARRTVTKYRKSLGIGSTHERKLSAHIICSK